MDRGASWFSWRCEASSRDAARNARLLTMRVRFLAAYDNLILRRRERPRTGRAKRGRRERCNQLSAVSKDGRIARKALHRRDAVDLDIKCAEPLRNADEDARRRVVRKVPRIDRIDGGKLLGRCAIDVALENAIQRRARRFDAELELLQHQLSLTLDRSLRNFSGCGIEGRKPRHVDRIAVPRGD